MAVSVMGGLNQCGRTVSVTGGLNQSGRYFDGWIECERLHALTCILGNSTNT